MRNLTELKEDVEALKQILQSTEKQQGRSSQRALALFNDVEEWISNLRGEIQQNRSDYELMLRDYKQAVSLLHMLDLWMLKATAHPANSSTTLDFDWHTSKDSGAKKLGDVEVAATDGRDFSSLEDYSEAELDQVRLGFQGLLKRKGNGVPETGEADESAN